MNTTTAFYLKYRPQSLDDLIGQDTVKKILQGAFKENRLSHAYLFVGPRGTGKTSTARILAKMINCEGKGERGKGEVPCNECLACLSITDGSNLDLIEIDAASNRGIEDIRSLREKIKLSPSSMKKKIYIIDEVHMLTTEAFNALLKTLEEPPNHAIFILATTDVNKLPQTILSRVQRLDFKLASAKELSLALNKIITFEKIDIDEEALILLIKKSEGSFRDGVKLLDQISSVGGKITLEILQKSLISTNFEDGLDLLETLGKKDTTAALSIVSNQVDAGVDVKELILSIMDILRNLVFIKHGLGESLVKTHYVEEKYKLLERAAENFTSKDLVKNLDILQKAFEKLKFATIPSLPLEIAMVEMCGENSKLEEVRSLKIEDQASTIQIQSPVSDIQYPTSNDDIAKIKEKWNFVLETIRQSNFSLEALLRSINISNCTEVAVILEVPYSFHQRILETPKNRDLLEAILSDILGRSIKVSTILGSRQPRREDIENIEVAADDEVIRAAAEIFNSDPLSSLDS